MWVRVGSYGLVWARVGLCGLVRFVWTRVLTLFLHFYAFLRMIRLFYACSGLVSYAFLHFLRLFSLVWLFVGSYEHSWGRTLRFLSFSRLFYAFMSFLRSIHLSTFRLILPKQLVSPSHWTTNLPAKPRVESRAVNEPTHIYKHTCIYNLIHIENIQILYFLKNVYTRHVYVITYKIWWVIHYKK